MNDITPNVPLLRKTLEHIEAHPQDWDQNHWRCETGMCFAGTACDLDGGEWSDESALVLRDGEPPEESYPVPAGTVHAATRAERILGLTYYQAHELFSPKNTLDDLRKHVAELCGEGHE